MTKKKKRKGESISDVISFLNEYPTWHLFGSTGSFPVRSGPRWFRPASVKARSNSSEKAHSWNVPANQWRSPLVTSFWPARMLPIWLDRCSTPMVAELSTD